MRKATKDFKVAFPSFDKLRHGVAHAAELRGTEKALDENAVKTEYHGQGFRKTADSPLFVSDHLADGVYSAVHQGHMRSYAVNSATLVALEAIRDQVLAAFRGAASTLL